MYFSYYTSCELTKHQKIEDNEDTEDGNSLLNVLVSHDMKCDY